MLPREQFQPLIEAPAQRCTSSGLVGCFCGAQSILHMEGQSYKTRDHFQLPFYTSSNRVFNKSFDSTIYIMMLTDTRNVLSRTLYLADTTSCTTHVIIQDGIDLMTQDMEKKAVLASLTGFVVSSSNIFWWDIAFGATKELLPSCNLTFLLVTN